MDERFERGPDGRSTDLPSGGGVPGWLAASLKFCSRCGARLTFGSIEGEDRDRLACTACGHIAYVNPRLVVTTFPVTEAGEIILIRRGIEPGKGLWAQPGGFLEVDETVNQGAIRETWEETGLLVEPGEIVGLYTRLEASVVTIVFEARIVGGVAAPTPEATEIVAYPPESIPWPEIAFRTTYYALGDWFGRRRPELEVPAISSGR
ncbi:MAG: NUDIX hydrolase [Solirubrobacterales bacterium]